MDVNAELLRIKARVSKTTNAHWKRKRYRLTVEDTLARLLHRTDLRTGVD